MAVWGTPTATEDDAERAVRAALDLVAAVSALGDEVGAELRARAGVLTGEAAVTIGAEGEGMVAGDLVNTASRIQSAAEPGTVLVGEATRRATEQAIVYEDAGAHELKGKDGPDAAVAGAARRLGRARHAQVGTGSRRRSSAATASCGRSRSSSTPAPRSGRRTSSRSPASPGSASRAWRGSSTSTSTGSPQLIYWHRGRCLAYGEGVDLLGARRHGADALPDRRGRGAGARRSRKLRGDARGAPARPGGAARSSSRGSRTCSGSRSTSRATGRTCSRPGGSSSSGWPTSTRPCSPSRTCSGRTRACSTSSSTCSSGRANSPALRDHARAPELLERRPTWGAGQRNFTSLYLEPLSAGGDGGAARAGSFPACRSDAARADPRPRRGRAALRGRDGADAARPRAARPGGAGLPADRARSRRSRCRRRCTR